MSPKKAALLTFALLAFAAAFSSILMAQRNKGRTQNPGPAIQTPIEGKLDIRAIDDIRVNGQKILLCGVAFTKPPSIRDLMTDSARRDYQGKPVSCRRVGAGTPCDGNVAAKFGDSVVAQCITADGVDIAAAFSKAGLLCDLPGQSGGHYTACPKP